MRPSNVVVFSSADASANASFVIPTGSMLAVSLQGVVTGASTGAVKLQFSNDPPGAAPTNFTDISGATATISAAGVFAIPKNDICYEWIKVVYTKNNGSAGTISAHAKLYGF